MNVIYDMEQKYTDFLCHTHAKFSIIKKTFFIKTPCHSIFESPRKSLSYGFPTRFNTNPAVQPQKMVRGLKFRV